MNKLLLVILFGVGSSLLITDIVTHNASYATTVVKPLELRPALPKVTRHQYFFSLKDMDTYVGQCIRDGYKITIVTNDASDGGSYFYVVAEKY